LGQGRTTFESGSQGGCELRPAALVLRHPPDDDLRRIRLAGTRASPTSLRRRRGPRHFGAGGEHPDFGSGTSAGFGQRGLSSLRVRRVVDRPMKRCRGHRLDHPQSCAKGDEAPRSLRTGGTRRKPSSSSFGKGSRAGTSRPASLRGGKDGALGNQTPPSGGGEQRPSKRSNPSGSEGGDHAGGEGLLRKP
jgi:hypothetical protein